MEVSGILDVFDFGGLHGAIEAAELLLAKLSLICSRETINLWGNETLHVLSVNSLASGVGEGLAVEVLTLDLGNVAGIVGDVLGFHVGGGASGPVGSSFAFVREDQVLVFAVLLWRRHVEGALSVLGLAHIDVDVVVRGMVRGFGDNFVDVARGAAVDFVFLGDVARVAREVLFLVSNFGHFLQLQI